MSTQDELYMLRCLELAQLGAGNVAPNPMVGAVLVYENQIIGEGYHQLYGQAHAEVNCINSVKEQHRHLICDATMYVSLEPCAHFGKTPPCADLIIRNNIKKVVVGCRDPFVAVDGKGIEKLKNAGIEVERSSLESNCIDLNKRFFTFHIQKRPYILLKWAQTANGFIARKNQQIDDRLYISNDLVNRYVHKWRQEEAAIMIGTQTAILDNPSLTNRFWTGKSPIRIVIDKDNKIPSQANIFNDQAETVVFSNKGNFVRENLTNVQIESPQDVLENILQYCYLNNIQSILVEGGQKTLQSFIDKEIWDEMRIITNTELLIDDGIHAPKIAKNIRIKDHQVLGNNTIDTIYSEKRTNQ